jgi:hypothetical protein
VTQCLLSDLSDSDLALPLLSDETVMSTETETLPPSPPGALGEPLPSSQEKQKRSDLLSSERERRRERRRDRRLKDPHKTETL